MKIIKHSKLRKIWNIKIANKFYLPYEDNLKSIQNSLDIFERLKNNYEIVFINYSKCPDIYKITHYDLKLIFYMIPFDKILYIYRSKKKK